MRMLRAIFALLLLLLIPAGAGAQNSNGWNIPQGEERILSFISDVTIEPDGDLDVIETIKIVSLGQEIRHGIQRDFPTTYTDKFGQSSHVGFDVVSVERDGHGEPWERMSLANGVRTRIGSADELVPPGVHTYVIHYRTSRQIHYDKDFDELYWNVTGTGWTFPIDTAEGRITLPKAAQFGDRAAYTGPQGATAHDAEVVEERPGYIAFRTTQPLGRQEGLTIAAAFPKGVLEEPGAARKAQWWLADWGAPVTGLLALIGLAFYYFRAWLKVGRGPRAGTIVPIFSPPDDLTPAAVRYISRMSFDNRAFSAAMVHLGVRGKLHITQEEGGWLSKGTTTLSRTEIDRPGMDRPGQGGGVGAPEMAMREKLFASGDEIELKQSNHTTLQAARSALQAGLAEAYQGKLFKKNTSWALAGIGLMLGAMLAIAVVGLIGDPTIGITEKLGPPLLALGLLIFAGGLVQVARGQKGCASVVAWIVVVLLGFGAAASAFGTIAMAVGAGGVAVFLPLLMLPVVVTAFWWMYAPTQEGRAVMDRIAGFKQYLSITEEERLEAMHPPEKTPELFERYLPYAIALDVENRWAERFVGVLAAAAAAGTATQTGMWYSGSGNYWDNPQGFASAMGSSLASTVSSASASPSSSSGSGGGGSSGGGGGGGGGSGW